MKPLSLLCVAFLAGCFYDCADERHFLVAAPIPPQPPKPKVTALTYKMLAGKTWAYSWGLLSDGVIALNSDGTYAAMHQPHSETIYGGLWWIEEGNVLTLSEHGYSTVTGEHICGPIEHRISFTNVADYPVNLVGEKASGTRVVLSKPTE